MIRTRLIGFALAVLFVLSGCSGYRIVKPDFVSPTVQSGTSPLPLTVGVKVVNQSVTGGFSDMGPTFASRLTNAGLFKNVLYPTRSDDKLDLLIEASFSGRFVADSGLFAKAFFTGFLLFLPASVIEYNHHYMATGSIQITQGGRQLKAYNADSDVVVEMKIFAPAAEIEREGPSAATSSLLDRVLAQLINDRAFFSGLRPASQ